MILRPLVSSIIQSAASRVLERAFGFLKIFLLTSGLLSLNEVDSYFLQLVTVSILFTSLLNAIEFSVNKYSSSGGASVGISAFSIMLYLYPILLILYALILSLSGYSVTTILMFSLFSLLYVTGFIIQIHARSKLIYWNNLIPELVQSLFICVAVVLGMVSNLFSLLMVSVIAQSLGLLILGLSSKFDTIIFSEIKQSIRVSLKVTYLKTFLNKQIFIYYGVTFMWAINHAVDRYLYEILTIDLVSISMMAFALILAPIQMANLEKISLLLYINNNKLKHKHHMDGTINYTLFAAVIISVIPVWFAYFIGSGNFIQLLIEFGYPDENAHKLVNIFFAYLPGLPAIMIIGTLDQIFSAKGRNVFVFIRLIFTISGNLILSNIFVLVYGMNVLGIAIATSVIYWVLLIVELVFLQRERQVLLGWFFYLIASLLGIFVFIWLISFYIHYRYLMIISSILVMSFIYLRISNQKNQN